MVRGSGRDWQRLALDENEWKGDYGITADECERLLADYRTGARKPLGFSQGMHGPPPGKRRTAEQYSSAGETATLAGQTRSPHTPPTGCPCFEHLALLVSGRVPPQCAVAQLGRWTGRVRRTWGVGLEL